MAEEYIIVCNCGEQKWLLCFDRIVCPECKAEHAYDEVVKIDPDFDDEPDVIGVNMDTTNRVKQMVDIATI